MPLPSRRGHPNFNDMDDIPAEQEQSGLTVSTETGVTRIDRSQWDALAGTEQPFLSHDFLSLLEQSGSVGERTGWQPLPLVLRDQTGTATAAMPAYLKGHSQGEYVFDHSWAQAWQQAGGRYYPKLQIAVPFTPVPGARVLGTDDDALLSLIQASAAFTAENNLSSAHATFVAPDQIALFQKAGWLIRTDQQFHWRNRGYGSFDDFLADLNSRKRKAIRKERRTAQAQVSIRRLSGSEIKPCHWDAFWNFYQDTGARKWGTPYLTREAFTLMGERMGEKLLLVIAEQDGMPVAGALNFIGPDRLYGRYWGALADIDCLHFELCYYQAIDAAIERGLAVVEAGAQGGHKLARGYEPTSTYSAHYIPHEQFRAAVADFLSRERAAVEDEIEFLGRMTPFKKSG